MKKIMDFSGSPEMLANILHQMEYETILAEIKDSKKVAMMILVEDDETYYVANPDDIKITKIGEHVQVEDDLHWNEHHEARMDRIGQNGPTGCHYFINGDEHDSEVVGA